MIKPYFLSIVGPTATGKSNLAINISKQIQSVIISMDSMQIYKYMDIGTAKPSKAELDTVKHEMIDIISPFENYSVSEYIRNVKELINQYNKKGVLPILTGGTALYLKSLINNYSFSNTIENKEYRDHLLSIAKNEDGKKQILEMLYKVDQQTAQKLHYNNTRRVIRALEIYNNTGVPMSEQQDSLCDNYDYCLIGLNKDRQKLYDDINKRVDIMVENGLVSEVKKLLELGLTSANQSMKGIGYKELVEYYTEQIPLNQCIDKIKQGSRRYAKRQVTFFKSIKEINWIFTDQTDNIISESIKIIEKSNIKDRLNYVK